MQKFKWYNTDVGEPFYLVQQQSKSTHEWISSASFVIESDAIEYYKRHSGYTLRVVFCKVILALTETMPKKHKPKLSIIEDDLSDKISDGLKVGMEVKLSYFSDPIATVVYQTEYFNAQK